MLPEPAPGDIGAFLGYFSDGRNMISFIIPAYNAEKTIKRAVESILPQESSDAASVEILIVENGSTDRTSQEAKALLERYPDSVRLLHSAKGVSNARNLGIASARGEWLFFLDADDRLFEGAVLRMTEDAAAYADADLIVYGHRAGNDTRAVAAGGTAYTDTPTELARVKMIENPTRYMQVWAKLFRAAPVKDSGVLFDPKIRLSEDSDFVLRVSRFCRRILFSDQIVYRYSLDNPSTMRVFDGKKSADFIEALNRTKEAAASETPSVAEAFDRYVLMNMNVLMVREIFSLQNPSSRKERMRQMKRTAAAPIFAEAIGRTNVFLNLHPRMLPVLLIKLRFYGAAAAVYRLRAKRNYRREASI